MNTYPASVQPTGSSARVGWDEPTHALLVEIAPVLAAAVRSELDRLSYPGEVDEVESALLVARDTLVLRFAAPAFADGGYVYVEAGTYGDLYVGPDPGSSIAERYNVEHPSWNPGGDDWLAVLPARIAAVLIGEEWFS